MHILVYSMGTKATRRKAAVLYAAHSLSRGNLKNLLPRSFTFVCQLYCCSSKHNNNKALRITFNSCKTVSTCSMVLATVHIDKIIKVTSASSYVYEILSGLSGICAGAFLVVFCPISSSMAQVVITDVRFEASIVLHRHTTIK